MGKSLDLFVTIAVLQERNNMPTINRPCRNRGCPNAQPCPDHPENKQYDQNRGSAAARGYDRAWRKVRAIKLANDPLCERCLKQGRTTAATLVHHIKPVDKYPELRLVPSNHESSCFDCHEIMEGRKKDEAI